LVSSDYYPEWLATALLEDKLPWSDAIESTMPAFLDSYTLHDSVWIGLALDPIYDGGGRAVFRWDTIWTDGRVAFPGSFVAEWPILIIDFHRVRRVELVGYELESPAPTRGIDHAESQTLDSDCHRTVIADHYGGQLEVLHAPAVRLLCLNRSGQVQPIPGLGAV